MALKTFTFNGINSGNYGIMASGNETYNVPSRSFSTVSVPGRNGMVYLDNGNWEPTTISYQCFSVGGLKSTMQNFLAAISSAPGYHELTDDWHQGYYRKAYLSGSTSVDAFADRHGGFKLNFTARPEKWLVTTDVELTADGTLTNPTLYDAKPIINLTLTSYTGTFTIARTVSGTVVDEWLIEYDDLTGDLVMDCETMNFTMNGFNANSYVTITKVTDSGELNMEFPYFPGNSTISISSSSWSGITKMTITPRWWTL